MPAMTALLRIRAHLIVACAILIASATGCGKSTINGGTPVDAARGPDADPATAAARAAFDDNVLTKLTNNCSCHTIPAQGVAFLESTPESDTYATLLAWEDGGLFDYDTTANSLLLTKGQHVGPAWSPEDYEIVREWIELEAVARGVEPVEAPTTALFTPTTGANIVDLSPLGLTGSSVSFLFEPLDTGAYLSEIRLNGGTGGARVVHPLFVAYVDGLAVPDRVDRFSFVDMAVEEDESQYIGGGTFVMLDFPPDSDLLIIFEVAERLDGGMGNDGGVLLACQDVTTFTASARPMLEFCSRNCHAGGDEDATGATDMRRMLDDMGQDVACGQILSRINLADTANSGIFLAPDPDSGTAHPWKFGDVLAVPPYSVAMHPAADFAALVTEILIWADSEAAMQPAP